MHLKSISLKGFKSFPDRTRLDFGPGVSVIVGPNGSGKSNITDAVLWAMGEQSPLAVRGQSMQDVIFGGARGQVARQTAEVEVVIDNSGGRLDVPFPEVSISRKLDRSGEGEYRLNGARCRLVDVLEALSDTGLGKEMHSIVSQGRVESIVTSKPKDRRMLIEEAAGLGKHRKRRRRAQLKLGHTQDNLDRALDVEREARSRLRPLKRQAEAAELHERLERQSTEARWTLARDAVRSARAELGAAEEAAATSRAARDEVDARLGAVAKRREASEGALAKRGAEREALTGRVFALRAAGERLDLRAEQVAGTIAGLEDRIARTRTALQAAGVLPDSSGRIADLETELESLDADRAVELERQLSELSTAEAEAAARAESAREKVARCREALIAADDAAEQARRARREAEVRAESARREAARIGAELAGVIQFLRTHEGAPGGGPALADLLQVEPGYEQALAAALGRHLRAAIVGDLAAGSLILDRAGENGGSALVAGSGDAAAVAGGEAQAPPMPGAERLLDRVSGPAAALGPASRLLADVWVVGRLEDVAAGFTGTAVTCAGRVWFGAWGEVRQAAQGGEDHVLSQRNRRDELIAETERVAGDESAASADTTAATEAVSEADSVRDEADGALRAAQRERDAAAEEHRRAQWLIEQRREAPDEGPAGVRRTQVAAALTAERALVQQARSAREERERRLQADERLLPQARRLAEALLAAREPIAAKEAAETASLEADREAGDKLAAELRDCARQEAEHQSELRARAEGVTSAEVTAQSVRDRAAEAEAELFGLAERLGLEAEAAADPLADEEREELERKIERLARRREQLGPVNPLAKDEYAEAVAYVEELERQRHDLEAAMRELKQLIDETDRMIREQFEETFNAAAQCFEEVVGELFPGGRGRLRLVREDAGPRPVLGGEAVPDEDAAGPGDQENSAGDDGDYGSTSSGDDPAGAGVEIEMTPAGKSMKRLSLLSGGEKSLTALAFLFAIFLARPCPFYVLDEVEAALDDPNIDRLLRLLRAYSERSQFIVVTHQKRTMEAADTLYGVSMGDDGVSKVISRKLPAHDASAAA